MEWSIRGAIAHDSCGNLLAVLRYGLNVIRNLSHDSWVRLIFISANNINVVVAGVGHQGSFTKPKSYLRKKKKLSRTCRISSTLIVKNL